MQENGQVNPLSGQGLLSGDKSLVWTRTYSATATQRPHTSENPKVGVARLRRYPGSKGVSWAAGRMASVPRTREACLSPRCLMATAASLLPSFLPAFVPCVCLPPPAGSVRPQSEGGSQRGRRGSAVHRSASRRGVRPGMGKKSPTTPVRTNLGKRNCVFWPLQCWGGGNVSSGCQICFWYPRRGPRPLPPALKAPARTIAFFRAGPTLPPRKILGLTILKSENPLSDFRKSRSEIRKPIF